jgi:hypothetical protein
MSKIWWTKMEHTDDYIAHYSMLSDSEIVADVRRSIASFANHTPEGDDFGAKMVRKALGRINEKHDQAVEAGSLGGKAKAQKTITADAPHREAGDERQHPSDGELLKSGTSANNSGEGGTPGIERTSSPLPSPTPVKTDPKPTKKAKAEGKPEEQKYPHGEFENIMLSTREYAKLCERLDNADSLIEEADAYLEAQPDKKKKYKNHYAMLLNWDRRRKEFEGVKPRFKTAVDRDQEEIRKLAEYYAEQESDERRDNPKMKLLGGA